MADQQDFNIPVKTWVQVATNAVTVTIYNKAPQYTYFRLYVTTGGAAPTVVVKESGIPTGAIPMFQRGLKELILNDAGMDVYVSCIGADYNKDTLGVVTVDA